MFSGTSRIAEKALQQTTIAVVTIDDQNRIVFYNDAAEQLWGYPRAEVMGRNIKLLVPRQHQASHDGYVNRHRLCQGCNRGCETAGRDRHAVTGGQRDQQCRGDHRCARCD